MNPKIYNHQLDAVKYEHEDAYAYDMTTFRDFQNCKKRSNI